MALMPGERLAQRGSGSELRQKSADF